MAELWPVQLDLVGPDAPIPERLTFQMRALLTFDDNSKVYVENDTVWSVPNSQYGSVSSTGLFTAGTVSSGTRNVQVNGQYFHEETGTFLTANAIVVVRDVDTPATLTSITITGEKEVARNSEGIYVVNARFSDGTVRQVTPTSFASNRPSIATVGVNGVAHFLKIRGSASVRFTATYTVGSVTANAHIDVLVVDSSIYPVSASMHGPAVLVERGCAKFALDVLFDNNKHREVQASWFNTNPKAGAIDCNGNFVAASVDSVEDTTIIGTYVYDDLPISASLQLSVVDITVRPVSLEIEGPARVREGLVVQYYTTLVFSNGTRKAVNARIQTSSIAGRIEGNQFYAASQVSGEIPVNLMAEYGDIVAYKTVDIVPSPVAPVSCYIELRSPMYVGEYQSLKFHVVYADGTDSVLPANWSLSNENIATITPSGVLYAEQVMETAELVVSASTSISGVPLSASLPLVIIDVTIYPISISIDGPDAIRADTPTQFTANAKFSDGSERPVNAKWVSESDVNIDFGMVTATVPGKRVLYVFYTLQHETVSAIKEIEVV